VSDTATLLTAASLVISACTPILLAIIARKQALATTAAATKVEDVRRDLADQSMALGNDVRAIHTAVNSERTKLLAKLEEMHREIAGLRADNAALKQSAKDRTE